MKCSDEFERVIRAAEHIKRVCPNDIAGQMVLAAFAQDAIDHEDTDKTQEERQS